MKDLVPSRLLNDFFHLNVMIAMLIKFGKIREETPTSSWVSTLPVHRNRLGLASLSGHTQVSVLIDSAIVKGLKEVFLEVTPCPVPAGEIRGELTQYFCTVTRSK